MCKNLFDMEVKIKISYDTVSSDWKIRRSQINSAMPMHVKKSPAESEMWLLDFY